MAKISKTAIFTFVWMLIGILWLPFFIVAWLLRIVARFVLAVSYFGLLNFKMGSDIIKSLFVWHDTKI